MSGGHCWHFTVKHREELSATVSSLWAWVMHMWITIMWREYAFRFICPSYVQSCIATPKLWLRGHMSWWHLLNMHIYSHILSSMPVIPTYDSCHSNLRMWHTVLCLVVFIVFNSKQYPPIISPSGCIIHTHILCVLWLQLIIIIGNS